MSSVKWLAIMSSTRRPSLFGVCPLCISCQLVHHWVAASIIRATVYSFVFVFIVIVVLIWFAFSNDRLWASSTGKENCCACTESGRQETFQTQLGEQGHRSGAGEEVPLWWLRCSSVYFCARHTKGEDV